MEPVPLVLCWSLRLRTTWRASSCCLCCLSGGHCGLPGETIGTKVDSERDRNKGTIKNPRFERGEKFAGFVYEMKQAFRVNCDCSTPIAPRL